MNEPRTLLQAVTYFADVDRSLEFMATLRWPDGVAVCPNCASTDVRFISTRKLWECKNKHPKRQFSIKVGTIFEDSPLGLDKWLPAVWMIANDKNGISSAELGRAIGVTQKSAWFMLHRIRLAMQTGTFRSMSGEVEVDETFIGGKAKFMHKSRREVSMKGRRAGSTGKTAVIGLLERHGPDGHSVVRTTPVAGRRRNHLSTEVRKNVKAQSDVFTDALKSYDDLDDQYFHYTIDHAEMYALGRVHTNGIENFWSLLKRSIKGTYVSVEPFHLFRYLDEQAFRYNERKITDGARFMRVLAEIIGKRLTYTELTGTVSTRPS